MSSRVFVTASLFAIVVGCRHAPTSTEGDVAAHLPGARPWMEGVWSAGQPDAEQLRALARAGVSSIVNLRPDGEPGMLDGEARLIEDLGMDYFHLPITGASDITEANARALDAYLSEHANETIVVHCKSGNRVGALAALRAYHVLGASAEEALAAGEQAGLTALKPYVEATLRP